GVAGSWGREPTMCETNASKSLKKQGAMLARRRNAMRNSSAFAVLLRAAPVALAAFAFGTEAQAVDIYSGASNGDWLNGAVWSTGVAPTTADDPTIVGGGSVLIGSGQSALGGRLDVLGGGSVTVNGSLQTGFLATIGIFPSTAAITTAPPGT